MERFLAIAVCLIAAFSCTRPSSYEPFVLRENAEYGDTYNFDLDLSDSLAAYSLSFYTRFQRKAYHPFGSDSLRLDMRWVSPSDSIIAVEDVLYVMSATIDSTYTNKDCVWEYMPSLHLAESGRWRLKVQVKDQPEYMRGLGIILKRED